MESQGQDSNLQLTAFEAAASTCWATMGRSARDQPPELFSCKKARRVVYTNGRDSCARQPRRAGRQQKAASCSSHDWRPKHTVGPMRPLCQAVALLISVTTCAGSISSAPSCSWTWTRPLLIHLWSVERLGAPGISLMSLTVSRTVRSSP